MSAFYDQASLVVVPSGYKSGKIYAQKPLTTDGQLTFTRASTATRVNASGLIESVASGVPRLDYTDSTCPKLLLEPQRTNLCPQSEQIENASFWTLTNSGTITSNNQISPDGYQNADTLNAGASNSQVQGAITGTSGAVYTVSIYIKRITGTGNVFLRAVENANTLISVTNEWQRFTATVTSTSTTIRIGVQLATSGDAVAIWGGQIEQASYATSYIPTLSTSVTRVADAASKTGISSLIGQTEGTIFVDFVKQNNASDTVPFDITGSDGKLIWIRRIGAQLYGNGTTLLADISSGSGTQGTRYKIAFVYGQNDFRVYANGSLIGTDTSGTFTGSFSNIALNSVINQANGFNQILLFKTKLTNAQMAELTTI
jgi:hypothetical protein